MKLTLVQRISAYSAAVALVAIIALIAVAGSYLRLKANATHSHTIVSIDKAAVDVARGLGELVLTEGSKSARELIEHSSKTLSDNLVFLSSNDVKASEVKLAWEEIQGKLLKLTSLKGVGPSDDDSLILFGSLQSKISTLVAMLDVMKVEAEQQSEIMLRQTFIGLGVALSLVVVFVVVSGWITRSTLNRRVGGDPVAGQGRDVPDGLDQVRLALPVGADERRHAAFGQRQRDIVEDGRFAEALDDMGERDHRLASSMQP